MIINPYIIALLTEEDAKALHRELLVFFEKNKAKEFPQLAEILKNLKSIK